MTENEAPVEVSPPDSQNIPDEYFQPDQPERQIDQNDQASNLILDETNFYIPDDPS